MKEPTKSVFFLRGLTKDASGLTSVTGSSRASGPPTTLPLHVALKLLFHIAEISFDKLVHLLYASLEAIRVRNRIVGEPFMFCEGYGGRCLETAGSEEGSHFVLARIAVWVMVDTVLYRRLLLSPVLISKPLPAILER